MFNNLLKHLFSWAALLPCWYWVNAGYSSANKTGLVAAVQINWHECVCNVFDGPSNQTMSQQAECQYTGDSKQLVKITTQSKSEISSQARLLLLAWVHRYLKQSPWFGWVYFDNQYKIVIDILFMLNKTLGFFVLLVQVSCLIKGTRRDSILLSRYNM